MGTIKKVFCTNCKKPIYRSIGRINENLKFGHNFYCSRKCEFRYKTKKQSLSCENCGKKIMRSPHRISPHNYCSHSCSAKISNKNRIKSTKIRICKRCGKEFIKIRGKLNYCSNDCRGKSWRKSPEEVLETIKNIVKKIKRVPARREFEGLNDLCVKNFGSWNNAIRTAGFIPNRSHDDRMYKRANTKALDGHLCDSISELLIDNWFTQNNIPHQKDILYPKTNHKADWKISVGNKEIFVEYFGLANDSPRYDRTVKEKIKLCQSSKIPLIEIYPKDIYPKNILDNNLKNKFREIFNV